LDGQNQDENIKIFCKIKSNKKTRFLIAKNQDFLQDLLIQQNHFALFLLQGSFCKAPFARLLLQSPFCKAT
jgi:hypothetical protein